MSMVCPQCQRGYEQRLSCPDCGVRLQFMLAIAKNTPAHSTFADDDNWQQTPWGRMGIGLLLAQGLGYAIQQMMTAGFMATGDSHVWTTLWGIVLLHAVQGMSLIIGGAICGAGQARGTTYGSLIGLINGIIFLMVQRQTGDLMTEVAIYGQPILHLAFGALGGLLGMVIWRPTPSFVSEETPRESSHPRPKASFSFQMLNGPVHLTRVLLGIAIVVLGVMWSNVVLEFALEASRGKLALKSHLQAQLVSWEISGLAILFGSGLAGACTMSGLKQGLCVGLGAAIVYAGIQLGNPNTHLEKTLLMMTSIFVLSVAGGWFGGQLLPPIIQRRRKGLVAAYE